VAIDGEMGNRKLLARFAFDWRRNFIWLVKGRGEPSQEEDKGKFNSRKLLWIPQQRKGKKSQRNLWHT